jgi:3-oxoacyl-[acyl-carrier protein] reductase
MKLLEGKVALITGAGRGMGSVTASLFAEHGASVVVHYNSSAKAAEGLASTIGGVALRANLTDEGEVASLVDQVVRRFGKIDILVNNAASFSFKSGFEEETWDDYQDQFDGVFGTTFRPTKAVVPFMIKQAEGRIINIAATLIQRPAPGYGAHTCAKAAVLALSRNLAKELGPHNITVNVVSPGMTLTEFTKSLPDADKLKVSSITPLRRLAEPSDVSSLCLFYASDLAKFITGANTAPDGGLAAM